MDASLIAAGFNPVRTTLETGDYLWVSKDNRTVGVERKTASDFLSSLSGKQANGRTRFQNQMDRMRTTYDVPILLIEGYLHPRSDGFTEIQAGNASGWYWDSLDNVLLSVQSAGILVVRCGRGRTASRLVTLRKYFDKPVHRLLSGTVVHSNVKGDSCTDAPELGKELAA